MTECDNIQIRDSQVGVQMAWHGKTDVQSVITKVNCRINYPMRMEPLHLLDADGSTRMKVVDEIDEKTGEPTGKLLTVPACEHFQVVSLDDNLPIGNPVKKGYKLISNDQMMDMVEASLAGTTHKIVSVGSINNREKVFCSIKLSDNIIAGNRETENVLNVLWGHGGVFSVRVMSGFIVVVCANTFAMALRDASKKGKKKNEFQAKVKHTGNADLKIENMAKAIDLHYGVAAEFTKAMDSLSNTPCNNDKARQLFAGFLVRDTEGLEEVSTRTSNTIDTLETLFVKGKGNNGDDMCDAFNAITDYYSHESSGGEDKWRQFESSDFGMGATRKSEAYDLLTGKKVRDVGTFEEVIARGNQVLRLV